ncbi:unnamed protein product, partial [Mesorhabditis belari]|uniref:Galectin n=1 Tax=Mesorhabditis belari TaxID=2138241 RepID=A0AAF3EN18_9BILA
MDAQKSSTSIRLLPERFFILAGEFSDNKTENHLLKLSFESENGLTPLSITSRMHSFWKNQVSLAAIEEVKFLNGIVMNDTLPSPLKDSNHFDIRIRFLEKQIQIFFNQGEIGTYPKPDSLAKVKGKNKNPDVKIDLEDFLKDLKNGRVKRQAVR